MSARLSSAACAPAAAAADRGEHDVGNFEAAGRQVAHERVDRLGRDQLATRPSRSTRRCCGRRSPRARTPSRRIAAASKRPSANTPWPRVSSSRDDRRRSASTPRRSRGTRHAERRAARRRCWPRTSPRRRGTRTRACRPSRASGSRREPDVVVAAPRLAAIEHFSGEREPLGRRIEHREPHAAARDRGRRDRAPTASSAGESPAMREQLRPRALALHARAAARVRLDHDVRVDPAEPERADARALARSSPRLGPARARETASPRAPGCGSSQCKLGGTTP